MKLSRILPLSLLVASAAFVPMASADDASDEARAKLADLEFEEAQALATSALEEGRRGPADTAELYLILGEISASLGEEATAQEQFERGLSIAPAAALPEGLSPKITAPFDAAKASLGDHAGITFEAKWQDDKSIAASADADPKGLVAGFRLRIDATDEKAEGTELDLSGSKRATVEIPAGAAGLHIVAVDSYGNTLGDESSIPDQSPFMKVKHKKKSGGSSGPAFYARWELYGALAVASAGFGTYMGLEANSISADIEALPDGTEFSVAQAMEEDAKDKALYANISFGVAGLFAAGAVWLFLDDDEETPAPATAIVPVLGRDEVGVSALLRF